MTPRNIPERRSHAERSAATRQHLIATAIEVIQHRSLEEMSIHELARSAGMTSGAVQHHFESKAVLMMRVLSELVAQRVEAGQLWPPRTLPAAQRAAQFVQTAWELIYAQPRFIVAWNIYLGCRNQPEVLGHIAQLRQQINAQMRDGFFDAFPELAAAPDREAFLGLVFSTLRGMGLLQLFPDAPAAGPQAQLQCLAGLIAGRCDAVATLPAARPARSTRSAPPARPRAPRP